MSFREIDQITNVTAFATMDATGVFSLDRAFPPADEIVVRQITYNSIAASKDVYLLRANFGIIGSIINTEGFVANPGTRIRIREPIAGPLIFQILAPTNPPSLVGGTAGDTISIHMDFIKYRN